jgi:hypothetical protein
METEATIAIAREAARLAFVCSHGICAHGIVAPEAIEPWPAIDSDSPFEQEKAELLAGIREEIRRHGGTHRTGLRSSDSSKSDLCLHVYRAVLAHLAGCHAYQEESSFVQ